jgi:hypothetical protein
MTSSVQCPCGRTITNAGEYNLVLLRKEQGEIDVLCPNDSCYLCEVGYLKFTMEEGKAKFQEAKFYPPFVTWNASQQGLEKASEGLKQHLKDLVTKFVNWKKISEDMRAAEAEPGTVVA